MARMVIVLAVLQLSLAVAAEGPCDITGRAGNPCVAAHSTTRALYAAYKGPLYNVTRGSDGKSTNVGVLEAGGFADIKTHDAFCSKGDCVISNVFDQSPNGNHLGQRHKLVNASKHRIIVGNNVHVYGMWFDPGYGYHVDKTRNIPTGNDPESIYAVMSGTHYNGDCCFDYGNSETDDRDDGCGTMEAIYFGNAHWHGNTGSGSGPWVGADLEQGMYYGGGNRTKINEQNKPLPHDFVTAYLRGRSDGFMLKGGDATTGKLTTMYDGPRPDPKIAGTCESKHEPDPKIPGTYTPMKKQGAIILATGGDESNRAMGKFYEGIMVTGETTDATDDAVQANIVAVGYRSVPMPTCRVTKQVGCYQDGGDRPISSNPDVLAHEATSGAEGSPSNSKENCAAMCRMDGYGDDDLVGVEFGTQCFCGNGFAVKQPQPSQECSMKCPGNSSDTCGGLFALEVFKATCTVPPTAAFTSSVPRALLGAPRDDHIFV